MDFDLQFLAQLRADSPPGDPCQFGPSQYYFRWTTTGLPHGQAFCSGPSDESWLEKAQSALNARLGPVFPTRLISPRMDMDTAKAFEMG